MLVNSMQRPYKNIIKNSILLNRIADLRMSYISKSLNELQHIFTVFFSFVHPF